MKFLQPALSILFFVLAVYCLAGMLLPDRSLVERQIVLPHDPAAVFARLDGFAAFDQVSPWAGSMPSLHVERSGPARGSGARLLWSTGSSHGDAVVAESSFPERLRIDVVDRSADVQPLPLVLELQPLDGGTVLTARMQVDHRGALASRWRGALSPAAHAVAADLALGLRRLRVLLQRSPQPD